MTFAEIVTEVAERLNLTSDTALVRIGKEVNDRYRRITSTIGLETSRRVETTQTATIGDRYMTFTGVEKLIAVIDKSSGTDIVLEQITFDDMHNVAVRAEPPRRYSVTRLGASSVDIYLDCVPVTQFTLYADAHTTVITMQDDDEPEFPESFHDVLVFGAMADEYRKMEKVSLMQDAEANYTQRLSDLRYWIAKSGYLDIIQGKYADGRLRWRRDPRTFWS